jgi:hypothetical protein
MTLTQVLLFATEKISTGEIGIQGQKTDGGQVVQSVLNTAYLWAGVICVLVIIIAGYFYVTSNGNAATIKRAKDALTGAIIGLIFVILAFSITLFILGKF